MHRRDGRLSARLDGGRRALLVAAALGAVGLPSLARAGDPLSDPSPMVAPTVRPAGCDATRIVCAASGSRVAFALDVAALRLREAERHLHADRKPLCRVAAADVVAVARGLTRYREQRRAAHRWKAGLRYLTDEGTLDERRLFARILALSDAAIALDAKCGGDGKQPPATTRSDEDSLFTRSLPGGAPQ